ncbi:hypothetical protein U879_01675 [Defluviimonas sp. 20V17]|uniref:Uncharacterized protein n=1 Tax=Allgaiera indica TaxID=765699 RepID=A0AAN5A1C1_9RHOB|nr:hypothetical protein [Allgaiera indica]KDB05404.1 hypothetical protein U879_01675 [Defluviimonas sp. 20V17]GHE04130.1 hypothetical protein GCM10008024_30000 [Allgaiera indica]SDX49703.1 hypothetical protein SAMN05444006_11821 [Allgaiera indica]
MRRITALFAGFARQEVDALRGNLTREATLWLLLVLFAVLAAGFAVALGVVALADWLGVLAALAISAGVALFICLICWASLAISRRRARRAAAERHAAELRALKLVLLEATPILRNAPLMAFAVALMAGLNLGRGTRHDTDDPPKPGP